jgi:hypothetical protein
MYSLKLCPNKQLFILNALRVTPPCKVSHKAEVLHEMINFFQSLARCPDVIDCSASVTIDNIIIILKAPDYLPLELVAACDYIDSAEGQGLDHGLSSVFLSIQQGSHLVRITRSMSDRKTTELAFLDGVSKVTQDINQYDSNGVKSMAQAVVLIIAASKALCAAVPKSSSDAAQRALKSLRESVAGIMVWVLEEHLVHEVPQWTDSACAGFSTTRSMCNLPSWPVATMQTVVDNRQTNGLDHMSCLCFAFTVHTGLVKAVEAFNLAGQDKLTAIESVKSDTSLSELAKQSEGHPYATLVSSLRNMHATMRSISDTQSAGLMRAETQKMSTAWGKARGCQNALCTF